MIEYDDINDLVYDYVRVNNMKYFGYTPLNNPIRSLTLIKILCPNNHEYESSYRNFKEGFRCPLCCPQFYDVHFTIPLNDATKSCGCYAIINDRLKIVYVGETYKSFYARWCSHKEDESKEYLFKEVDTEFRILEYSRPIKKLTEELETKYINVYKDRGYKVYGGTYRSKSWKYN